MIESWVTGVISQVMMEIYCTFTSVSVMTICYFLISTNRVMIKQWRFGEYLIGSWKLQLRSRSKSAEGRPIFCVLIGPPMDSMWFRLMQWIMGVLSQRLSKEMGGRREWILLGIGKPSRVWYGNVKALKITFLNKSENCTKLPAKQALEWRLRWTNINLLHNHSIIVELLIAIYLINHFSVTLHCEFVIIKFGFTSKRPCLA